MPQKRLLCLKFLFCLRKYFLKFTHQDFFLMLSYLASGLKKTFAPVTHFCTTFYLSIQRRPLIFQKKDGLNFLDKKYLLRKPLEISQEKKSMMESFLSTLAGLPTRFRKTCLGQLYCREHDGAWLHKSELHIRRDLGDLKTRKVYGC